MSTEPVDVAVTVPRERRRSGRLYGRASSEVAGPLRPPAPLVQYRKVLTRRQLVTMVAVGALHIDTSMALVVYILWPAHLPVLRPGQPVANVLAVAGLVVLVALQLTAGFRTWVTTYFLAHARDPIPMCAQPRLKVAVLTTMVPGKEPLELVCTTLRAMKRIRHDGHMDVWLLDEGDSPEVRRRCAELGVKHFSRKGVERWNQPAGPFKAKTKHGNHNSWREGHAADYDVVAQMDPDHVPFPHFLERTLGYFADPDVGFVVAPQVYGNMRESFVARGAAQMSYMFHGVTQRGANAFGAPILIGTNHLYRPSTFEVIGGYQDSIIEDHLTAIVVYGHRNPATGAYWKGVYTPDVLAVGEGPATYTDWFSQQKRWAYGIWEVIRRHSFHAIPAMPLRSQRRCFAMLQAHYPLAGLSWLAGILLFGLYLLGGISVTQLPVDIWLALFLANGMLGLTHFQMTRCLNLAEHERTSWNLSGIALDLITGPVFSAAAIAQLSGRPLSYVVTPKGSAATGDTWRTFRPHLLWLGAALGSIAVGLALGHSYPTLLFWAALVALICLAPMLQVILSRLAESLPELSERVKPVLGSRRIGDILVEQRLISADQLRGLLDLQATADMPWCRLGELAVAEGMISPAELNAALLAATPSRRRPTELPRAGAAAA
jgi:cellulose synthase (UDP-forming)